MSISVTPDNKVTKIIHKEGNGPIPKPGERVVLIYEGRIKQTGVVFDSSKNNKKKFKFLLGKDEVIDGLTAAVSSMHLGESATFTIEPEYGYGEKGREPTIPPNAVLEFDIELYDIQEKFYNAIDADKRAKELNEQAKELFKSKKYNEAINIYRRAFHVVDEWVNEESQKLKVQLSRNLATCYGLVKNWTKSLKRAEYVLKYESGDARAIFRKAEALVELNQFDQARQAILLGLGVTNNSPQFIELNNRLNEYERPENNRKNQIYAKMFGK